MPDNHVIEAVDEYCKRLSKALHKVPSPERDDFVREVRSHILERVNAKSEITAHALTEIFRAVGEPRELAAEYRTQAMLREATRDKASWLMRPWVLLRTTLRWGLTSLTGLVVFFVTLIGYGCTIVFYLCALLKPIFPSRIGLWLAAQHTLSLGYWNGRSSETEVYGLSVRPPISFVFGTLGPTDGPIRELLGYWLIPVGFLCGALFFIAITIFVRWLIGRFRRKQIWDAQISYVTSVPQSGRA